MTEAIQRSENTEQQQTRYSSPMAAFSQSILELTDPKNILTALDYMLRQAKYNPVTNEYEIVKKEALLNEKGIRNVLAIVQSIISQNTVMSNIDSREVRAIMAMLTYTVTQQLMLNRREWGIKNSED